MRLDTAIFDLDGTLVDSASICASIFNTMLRERGHAGDLKADAVQSTLSVGGEPMIRAVFGDYCRSPAADLVDFRSRYAALPTPRESLYAGVEDVLHGLRHRGIKIGLCTKKPERLAEKVLHDLGLRQFFDAVSCGDSTPHPKPDKRHLKGVLDRLGTSHEHAVMIGDSVVDFDVASNAHVRFVFARYGYDAGEVAEEHCFACIDQPIKLLHLDWDAVPAGGEAERLYRSKPPVRMRAGAGLPISLD